MSEIMESQGSSTSEMDSAVASSHSNTCSEIAIPFNFPSLPFQVSFPRSELKLPDISKSVEQDISKSWELYGELRRKMRRRTFRGPYKPVLSRIYEKEIDSDQSDHHVLVEPSDKEMKYHSLFDRHREDRVIYQDVGMFITQSNKNRRLCEAVCRNEVSFVKRLLDLGISPNCFDNFKRTPLHIAVSKGHCEMVQLLLDMGADPNMKDGLSNSCLHLAACTNNVEMALILIRGGASVHAVDIRGRSPIQLAQSKLRILQQCPDGFIKTKVKQVIDMLLMYLAKNNERPDSSTALLTTFQNKLQITDTPEEITCEIDNLSKILDQMGSLTIT